MRRHQARTTTSDSTEFFPFIIPRASLFTCCPTLGHRFTVLVLLYGRRCTDDAKYRNPPPRLGMRTASGACRGAWSWQKSIIPQPFAAKPNREDGILYSSRYLSTVWSIELFGSWPLMNLLGDRGVPHVDCCGTLRADTLMAARTSQQAEASVVLRQQRGVEL